MLLPKECPRQRKHLHTPLFLTTFSSHPDRSTHYDQRVTSKLEAKEKKQKSTMSTRNGYEARSNLVVASWPRCQPRPRQNFSSSLDFLTPLLFSIVSLFSLFHHIYPVGFSVLRPFQKNNNEVFVS